MAFFVNYDPADGKIISYQEAPSETEADPIPAGLERVAKAAPVSLEGAIVKDGVLVLVKNGLAL